MQVKDSVFLVSGGGSGLGAATARRLGAAGAKIVIVDVNEREGAAVARELGAQACCVRTDVADEAQVKHAVESAVKRFGALHGAVSCAGVAIGERVLGREGPHRLEPFTRVVNVNLVGTFNVMRLAAQAIANNVPDAEGERGVIINTASVAAFEGQLGQVAYAASKAGIVGLTLPAARELAKFGIRVMTIAPGIFDTPMSGAMSDELRASLASQVPFPPRLGKPEEYAALAEHIIVNPMLNGEVIRLDGALRMGSR